MAYSDGWLWAMHVEGLLVDSTLRARMQVPLSKPMLILEMIGRAGGSVRWSIGARVRGGRTCVHGRSMLDGMEHT